MRKLRLLVGTTLLMGAFFFAQAGLVSAYSFRSGTNVTLGQGQPINDTVFAAGRTVDINTEIFGDVFCAGQTVTITGTVHGDVICAGQTVNVTGAVDGDVRLAGQTVTVGANVGGNATIAGQTFNLESTGSIAGDASVGSADATFNGPVGRDIAAGGDNVTVASTVGRNIVASGTNLTLTSSARINGDVTFTSNNEVNQEEGSVVTGSVTVKEPTQPAASKRGAVFGFGVAWFIYWFFAMLLTALALALLFPRMLKAVTDNALPRPWKALLTGFLASIAVPIALIVLAITFIGLPLAFILGLLWFVAFLLSGPIFGFYLGRLVLRESRQALLIMLVGASVLLVLYFIPIIGFLAFLAAFWIGTGMLLLEVFRRTPKPSYHIAQTSGRK